MSVTEHTTPDTSFPRRTADQEPNLATLSRLRAGGRVPSLSLPRRRALSPRPASKRPCSQPPVA
jgi:hypothetical protein